MGGSLPSDPEMPALNLVLDFQTSTNVREKNSLIDRASEWFVVETKQNKTNNEKTMNTRYGENTAPHF